MDSILQIDWDFYKASAIIAAIGAFILCLISFIKNPKNKLNTTISFFNLIVMVWIVLLFLLRIIKDLETANFMVRYFGAAMFLLPVVFLRFSIIFTKNENKWIKTVYYGLLFSTLVLIIMSLLKIGTKSLYYKTDGGYFIAQPDLVYSIFNYNLITGIAAGVYLLIRKFLSSGIQPIEKKQTQYVLLAFVILALFGITNQLDIFGIKVAPMAVFGAFIYILIMTYAALTFDLLQIKELLAKLLANVLVAAGFSVMSIALLLVLNSMSTLNMQILFGLPAGALIILLVNRISIEANKFSGKLLLSGTDFDAALNLMHESTKSCTRAGEIVEQISAITSEILRVEKMVFIIRRSQGTNFTDEQNKLNISGNSPLVKLLEKRKTLLYFEELNNQLYYSGGNNEEKAQLREILEVYGAAGAEICLPVFFGSGLHGMWFIGGKKSGNIFSRREMRLINSVLNLFSIRLENILLYEKLMGTERLAMLGQMAAAVAHEIRNPLTGLSGFVQMINEGKERSGRIVDRFFQIAPGELSRLEKLTDNLLALSHSTKLTLVSEDINDIMSNVAEFMNYLFKKNKIEKKIIKGNVPRISIDREQVRQALLNLIINAVQSMPDGGALELESGVVNREHKDLVYLSVKDSGNGIDASVADRIFDPFFTTKTNGSGLGLAICRNIMNAHGGFIEYKANTSAGTCFYLFFPTGN